MTVSQISTPQAPADVPCPPWCTQAHCGGPYDIDHDGTPLRIHSTGDVTLGTGADVVECSVNADDWWEGGQSRLSPPMVQVGGVDVTPDDAEAFALELLQLVATARRIAS